MPSSVGSGGSGVAADIGLPAANKKLHWLSYQVRACVRWRCGGVQCGAVVLVLVLVLALRY